VGVRAAGVRAAGVRAAGVRAAGRRDTNKRHPDLHLFNTIESSTKNAKHF